MATASNSFQAIMTGTPEERVEALRQYLSYPIKERDPEKDQFWYLRPGTDEEMARETQPIAVGFYEKLNEGSDTEIKAWVVSKENAVSDHFFDWGDFTNQPAMYLLLPEAEQAGRVVLVLPSESRQWRQRQVLTYKWNEKALQTPLGRLKQGELELMQKVEDNPMFSVPLVEWAFYKPIATAKELAQELARVSRDMEQIIAGYKESTLNEYLRDLFNSFKRELLPNLEVSSSNVKDYSFADIYAQTIAYGLFTARVFSHVRNPKENFNRQDAWDKLPETNPFLRQLFQGISKQPVEALGDDLADKISEVFSILRAAKMDAILSDFRQKMNREDIVIRFYEDFLAAYKPAMRERRGVYYTPEPVVSYMVRSVDILLKEKFDKPLGLADPEVMILDPACGTGTFLLSIFQHIHRQFEESPEALTEDLTDKSWSGYVKEQLLPRIFGFELLMAPYAIAHLKLSLFLEETGYKFEEGKRLGIFLTNSLDGSIQKSQSLFEEFIAEESDQASAVKIDKPIMTVIGNPPYEGESANKNIKWINELVAGNDPISDTNVENYFEVDGVSLKDLGERNTKWLNNDYVKFMRLGHWRIERTHEGIVAMITDRSFLGGRTFCGMRQSLLNSFNIIKILDLHGNVRGRRKDLTVEDENVFAISQGTSISFLVKQKNTQHKVKEFYHADLWGKWAELDDLSQKTFKLNCKAGWLSERDIQSTEWSQKNPRPPSYSFEFINEENSESEIESLHHDYEQGWKITDIFQLHSMGITGGLDRTKLCPQMSKHEMWDLINKFADTPVETSQSQFDIKKEERIVIAKNDIKSSGISLDKIVPIFYRPFDIRFTYYTGNSQGFHYRPRNKVMRHLLSKENVALCFIRGSREGISSNFIVSQHITDKTVLSSSDNSNVAPLYIYPDNDSPMALRESIKSNFSPDFLQFLSVKFGEKLKTEIIFAYIYAILYSPSYRSLYSSFIANDFPQIPITSNRPLFDLLSKYGKELINLHLLKSPDLDFSGTDFMEKLGKRQVRIGSANTAWSNGKVIINNQGDGFTGVPEEVWNFYVGGYQVCHKWLKDRKGRILSDDDILHYQKIIVVLQETIRIMQQIDEAIPSWPIK
jgi:predicted helicase